MRCCINSRARGAVQRQLADALVAHIEPIGLRTREYLADPTALDHMLQAGARKAEAIAEPIAQEAERLVGFLARG
jgi:tryptophanyl-tRNA synthetase